VKVKFSTKARLMVTPSILPGMGDNAGAEGVMIQC